MASICEENPDGFNGDEVDELAEDGNVDSPKHARVEHVGPKSARKVDSGEEDPDVDTPAIYNRCIDHQKHRNEVNDDPYSEKVVGRSHGQEMLIRGGLGLSADCEGGEERHKKSQAACNSEPKLGVRSGLGCEALEMPEQLLMHLNDYKLNKKSSPFLITPLEGHLGSSF